MSDPTRPRAPTGTAALLFAALLLAALLLAALLLGGCAPAVRPPDERVALMQPAAEVALPRRRVSEPLDPRDAEPSRPWCRRACRHLLDLSQDSSAGEVEVEQCTETCRTWASGERIRCILEAETTHDARECAF